VVRPWFTNVAKALRKEPKWFLRDWSGIDDAGQRAETFVACHLLKAVEGWTDLGLGGLFKQQTKARHAFQAVVELPYAEVDCFSRTDPVVVPDAAARLVRRRSRRPQRVGKSRSGKRRLLCSQFTGRLCYGHGLLQYGPTIERGIRHRFFGQ
jgi:hypothetical protein